MNTSEQELREALAEFMKAAPQTDTEHTRKALNRIIDLEQRLGADADPMLRHYLERRSYQKALDFLATGRAETQTPQCGR
jgi:hypothetical protein